MLRNYNNTLIYKLVCNDLTVTDVYVGHTTDFTKRKYRHKIVCSNVNSKSYNLKVYTIIRDNGGWENWTMVEVEKYPCNDSNEARARERHWYEILNANMNSQIPNRPNEGCKVHYERYKEWHENYYKNNKECIALKKKEYRDANKDAINARTKELRNANKEAINTPSKKLSKEKIKLRKQEWYEKNKECIALKKKEYYNDNKDVINTRRKELRRVNKKTLEINNNSLVISI